MNYPYYPQSGYPQPQLQQSSFMPGRPTFMDMAQQQQSQPQMQTPYPGIKGRPVASYDEAKASMIDFDGSVFYFPDPANQRIYTKQINLDGTSSLKVYSLVENPLPQSSLSALPENVVTKEELKSIIENLKEEIQSLKGAQNTDDKPTAIGSNASTVNKF